MRNGHFIQYLEYGKKFEKTEKLERPTIGNGIRRETQKNVYNVKCTLQDMDYGEKNEKRGK